MTQSAESIAQKIYGQFHSGKTVPEEIQLITDAIQTERAKAEARITKLEGALRSFCDFHEKNASWDKTGEVYYKAMALLPIRFPSPSLSTKEASND